MKVAKRIRVNARLPDHQDKFRDEITQEFTIELDVPDITKLDVVTELVNERMASQLGDILERIKELGGRDYTEE